MMVFTGAATHRRWVFSVLCVWGRHRPGRPQSFRDVPPEVRLTLQRLLAFVFAGSPAHSSARTLTPYAA